MTINKSAFLLLGKHSVESYLKRIKSNPSEVNPRNCKLFVKSHAKKGKTEIPQSAETSLGLAEKLGIPVMHCNHAEDFPGGMEQAHHQNVALAVPQPAMKQLSVAERICDEAKQAQVKGCIGIVLDQIQDPHNYGAILRSAAYFGVQFAIVGKDRQAPFTPTVARSSAGGAFALEVIEVVNLSRALEAMKEHGVWVACTALTPDAVDIRKCNVDRPFVLVVSNEGAGVRPEIKKKCDYIFKIPGGSDVVDSLNVSAATAIFLDRLSLA